MFFQGAKDHSTTVLLLIFLLFLMMARERTLLAETPKSLSLRMPAKKSLSNNIREKQGDKGEYLITVSPGTKPEKLSQLFQENLVFSRKISKTLFHIKLKGDIGLEKVNKHMEQTLWMIAIQPNYTYKAFTRPQFK